MRTITFEKMMVILEDCSAVIWGDMRMVVYPSYQMPEAKTSGDDAEEEEFLHLEGVDSDFNEYEVNFKEKDNREVQVEGNHFYLIDTQGERVEICPVFAKDLSEYK